MGENCFAMNMNMQRELIRHKRCGAVGKQGAIYWACTLGDFSLATKFRRRERRSGGKQLSKQARLPALSRFTMRTVSSEVNPGKFVRYPALSTEKLDEDCNRQTAV